MNTLRRCPPLGIEAPVEQEEEAASSLPFGFGGESQTNISRLPFGIGSHPEGIPFELSNQDSGQEKEEIVQHVEPVIEPTNLEPVAALETEQHDSLVVSTSVEFEPVLAPVEAPDLPLMEEPPIQVPGPIRLTAIPFVEPAPWGPRTQTQCGGRPRVKGCPSRWRS